MPRDIRFFGIIGVILFISGIVMVYLSGITANLINPKPIATPKPAITAIVITQTRVPHNPWQGTWKCQNIDDTSLTITMDGNFYAVTDEQNTTLVAVLSDEELQVEDGRIFRLNSQQNMLIVKTADDMSYFCTLDKALTVTPTP
jgi:hypothetical protein